MSTNTSYLAADPEFLEGLEKDYQKHTKVFYFDAANEVEEAKGTLLKTISNNDGEFLVFENHTKVRLDKIITLNGRPGPAYEKYDAFANACLSCQAGYDET